MEFVADLEHLYAMLEYIRKEAERCKLNAEKQRRAELISEEAIVNVINHATTPDKKISITCNLTSDGHFQVTLRDKGKAFNPLEVDVPKDLDKPLDERKIGGLGIFMIRKMADYLSYSREGTENVFNISIKA